MKGTRKMKKALSLLLFTAMIVALFAFPTSAAWDGTASASLKGDGTQDSPYLVETAEDLAFLAKSVNEGNTYEGKYIVQTADIDLGGKEWTPIGHQKINSAETDAPFSGVYSGLGHKVTGLSITTVGDSHVGLFGYVMSGEVEAGIADLTVEGAITLDGVTASNFGVAAIAGSIAKDTSTFNAKLYVINCTANVDISLTNCKGEPRVGAVAGYIFNAKVENCKASGNVSVVGEKAIRAGGFVGQTNRSQYLDCIADVNVTSDAGNANVTARAAGFCGVITRGGVAGDEATAEYTTFENIITNGDISGRSGNAVMAAGIAADYYVNNKTWAGLDIKVKMINCINNGNITAESTGTSGYPHAGGIGGYTGNGYFDYEFIACVNGGEVKSIGGKQERAGGIIGSVYSGKAEYVFDQCISVGELKSVCFTLANKETALATSTANADAAMIAAANTKVEGLMKTSEKTIAGFDTTKGSPAPEVTVPETTEPATPPTTGDASVIFVVIAIISLCGVAVISKRKEN